jgi:HD superfamily phosphohydrolase
MKENTIVPVSIKYQQVSGFKRTQKNAKEIRKVYDNIHSFIYFPQLVWDFVDTPHFQRLRKIKQLGCLEYVFPGSTHTRFEHSLGTAYLAQTFMKILIKNNPECYEKEDK